MPSGQDYEKVSPLVGTADNPARDPKMRKVAQGPGSVGDQAFKDIVIAIAIAWLLVILYMYSLRHHNI